MELERVQILLRPSEREAVRAEARRLGLSVSEVIRRALEPLVKANCGSGDDRFASIVGLIDDPDLPTDLSENVKHYLYGWPKKDPSGHPS